MSSKNSPELICGHCIFCGKFSLMTGEHVWDAWTRSYISLNKSKYNVRYRYINQNQPAIHVTPYKNNPSDTKSYCVCRNCNTTWMSDVTNQAKPIVIKLINSLSVRLGEHEQARLANWLAVKAITAEFLCRPAVAISDEDRHYVFSNKKCPPDWRIWIGNFERQSWDTNYLHDTGRFDLIGLPNPPTNSFSDYNIQCATYIFGKFFVIIMTSFETSALILWRFCDMARKFIRPIWPLSGYGIQWPPPLTMNDDIADYLSSAFIKHVETTVGASDEAPR